LEQIYIRKFDIVISFVTVIISSFILLHNSDSDRVFECSVVQIQDPEYDADTDDVIESSNCKKKVKRKYTFQNDLRDSFCEDGNIRSLKYLIIAFKSLSLACKSLTLLGVKSQFWNKFISESLIL
jgi:hypothetical protein